MVLLLDFIPSFLVSFANILEVMNKTGIQLDLTDFFDIPPCVCFVESTTWLENFIFSEISTDFRTWSQILFGFFQYPGCLDLIL